MGRKKSSIKSQLHKSCFLLKYFLVKGRGNKSQKYPFLPIPWEERGTRSEFF